MVGRWSSARLVSKAPDAGNISSYRFWRLPGLDSGPRLKWLRFSGTTLLCHRKEAICFFLVLLSLVTTRSTYADASNDAKRDKAIVLGPGENRDRHLRPGMNVAPNVYLQ